MFIARAGLDAGKELLVLGISKLNVERLKLGRPMDISRETHGMAMPENIKIMIFYGENEEAMQEQMAGLIGPQTIVDQRKPI